MSFVFLVSILLKGLGAVLEVALQVIITKRIGVSDYGSYSAFINTADLIYWCLFSGLVKCNTFYLSETGSTIRSFKKKYLCFYVLPVTLGGITVAILLHRYMMCLIFAVAFAELLVMDGSSSFMARKYSKRALLGEYVLGRFLLLGGVLLLFQFSITSISLLVTLYLLQFLLIEVFFLAQKRQMPRSTKMREVSIRKWSNYQRADIIQSMIGQMPVIIPFFFVGSFEAGVVSVVMLVKKLVNFISGPSFKVFLPEFSRLYQAGDIKGIKKSFESIIRMQMLFLSPMLVILVGFPQVLLKMMADELLDYVPLFILCSITFVVIASFGPCSGLMQMTGNEKWDNYFREFALVCMVITFVLMKHNPFFVLYGLCIQAIVENIGKVIFISRWMGATPIHPVSYLSLWMLPALVIAVAKFSGVQNSFVVMLLFSGVTFALTLIIEARELNLKDMIRKKVDK